MKKKEPEPRLDEMTLRDLMAMFAMVGLLQRNANSDSTACERIWVAKDSYLQADSMIEERMKK